MPTYRLDLSYDGTGFRGFARQHDVRTVQGELEAALARIVGAPVDTTCAGRTDAGVHARHQVVSFVCEPVLDEARVVRGLTAMLGPEIAATACREAPEGFDARFSARWRAYRYQILNAPHPDPLVHRTTWHVADRLDLGRMNRAAAGFVGRHDFASFCRRAEGRTTMRTVIEAGWRSDPPLCVFAVSASAFCHQMVRSLTGFCVDAGRGRVEPESVVDVLAARDRGAARPMAPARGLILWDVGYDEDSRPTDDD